MIALGVSLASVPIWANGVSFSPLSLFSASEPGVWLDPSDLMTLFQDAAGTTPVTAPGQSVGLVLDKSRGAVGTNGASRRNLLTYTEQFDNAAFGKVGSTITTNTSTAPDGTTTADLLVETTTTGEHLVSSVNIGTGQKTASVYFKAAERTQAAIYFFNATNGVSVSYFDLSAGTVVSGAGVISDAGNGWYRCSLSRTATANDNVYFCAAVGGSTSYAGSTSSGILIWGAQLEVGSTATSYQRITADWPSTMVGNHATQSIFASRPTYALHPSSGIRNVANGSADVGNTAFWPASSTQNGITATKIGSGFDTDGLPYVDVRYQGTASSTFHTIAYSGDQSRTASATGVAWATSLVARVISGTVTGVLGLRASVREETSPSTFVGISDGNAITSSTDTTSTATRTLSTGNQASALVSLNFTNGATIDVTYRIKGLQLERGSSRTAYQFNYANFNIVEAPFAQVGNLLFDGIDDFLVTPTITPGIDKAQVFAGVRKLTDAAQGVVAELGVNSGGGGVENGVFGLLMPRTAGQGEFAFNSKGTVTAAITSSGFAAPQSAVLTAQAQIAADSVSLRVNGSQSATSAADQGTGNFGNYPIYIGRRGGAAQPFNGRIYGLITRFGANLTADQITQTETWMNSKTGAF